MRSGNGPEILPAPVPRREFSSTSIRAISTWSQRVADQQTRVAAERAQLSPGVATTPTIKASSETNQQSAGRISTANAEFKHLIVNGQHRSLDVDLDTPLLWVI